MHVAIIGAGASGLCAARHLTDSNSSFTCVVFEQTNTVGGTWVYTEATGLDEYGLPICSSMYKNLRTNLPTANMEFSGFPFVHPKSFVTANDVLTYLNAFADHFELRKHIKFLHHVKRITPIEEKWKICYVDLLTKLEGNEQFDAVIVCNGHNSVPYTEHFPGISNFNGEVQHSHYYRIPESYKDKSVLVCGGGPSGIDISYDLAKFATKVYFSHKNFLPAKAFPDNVEHVPIIKLVNSDSVLFEDGTTSGHIDLILICTGYKYSFPFLSPECEVTVAEDKFVYPLYKHIVNVNYPTMAFIGIPFRSFLFPLFDCQVLFFLKSLIGDVKLPSKEVMLTDVEKTMEEKKKEGIPIRKYFDIGNEMKCYIDFLIETAGLKHFPPVVYNIYKATKNLRNHYLSNYRDAKFYVVDENTFRMTGLIVDDKYLNQTQDNDVST